ncbi:hypothetical protein KC131_17275 [Pseudomonas sp. JQ170]|uniref:hypothetical protein n=1 Tax=unclassified Pseudomonas TaxID=196821 RepID=UPI002653A2DD|nr:MULTISPECIES: hypothetical protein [unclassified Pseudomonas]MDN7142400.1 hypothetical protein [Pseudomonas sp. JQ170]WRO74037.1 hypothetical protein U9R80_16030 [Pseudomonas sp. 170C]
MNAQPGERQVLLDYQARRRASARVLATALHPLERPAPPEPDAGRPAELRRRRFV